MQHAHLRSMKSKLLRSSPGPTVAVMVYSMITRSVDSGATWGEGPEDKQRDDHEVSGLGGRLGGGC